jgi:hypothetical protein
LGYRGGSVEEGRSVEGRSVEGRSGGSEQSRRGSSKGNGVIQVTTRVASKHNAGVSKESLSDQVTHCTCASTTGGLFWRDTWDEAGRIVETLPAPSKYKRPSTRNAPTLQSQTHKPIRIHSPDARPDRRADALAQVVSRPATLAQPMTSS